MMEIKVTVILPGVPEAINNLANAIANSAPVQTVPVSAPVVIDEPKPETVKADVVPQTVTADMNATPQQTAVNPDPAPVVDTNAAPTNEAPSDVPTKTYTREEIANAGSVLVSQGKMNELLALLQKYGVASVVQLPADKYPAFAADLNALGAVL